MKTIQDYLDHLLIARSVYTDVESNLYKAVSRLIPLSDGYSVFVNVNEDALKIADASTPFTSIVTMVVVNSAFQEKENRLLPLHVLTQFNEVLITFINNGVLPAGDPELFQKFIKFAEQSHG